jgi:NAD(P)-dependent dehydrogenase (short-subunit alcohol dehydrogenase family)
LEEKVAIVTGASAGIGRAYALALADAGATVVALARTLGQPDSSKAPARNSLEEVVKASEALPGRVYAQICDVENETDIVRAVDQAVANFGHIDVLVNNAATMQYFRPFEITAEDWDWVMRINVRAAYVAMRQVAPHMIRQRSGSIINITAAAANFAPEGHRTHAAVTYAVSKAALNRLSSFMAEELRPYGIAVNALSPGIVATDTVLAARPGVNARDVGKAPTPEVLGPALLYLSEQTAESLTAGILHTDEFRKSWP